MTLSEARSRLSSITKKPLPSFLSAKISIGPSHGFVHVVEIGTPVGIMGMTVKQGELIHADRHGAVVIPDTVIPYLKSSIEKVFASEAIILGPARQPGFDIHKLEEAWAEFEKART